MTHDRFFILLLVGVPLLLWALAGVRWLARGYATRHWLPVPSEVVKVSPRFWPSYGLPLALARIEYRYTVGGTTYTGSDLGSGAGAPFISLWPAPKGLAPGSSPTAYYDPRNPSRAVLRRGTGPRDWLTLLMPLALLAIILLLLQPL
jgi:hypothetical protein